MITNVTAVTAVSETAPHTELKRRVANGFEFTGENTSYIGLQVYIPLAVESNVTKQINECTSAATGSQLITDQLQVFDTMLQRWI